MKILFIINPVAGRGRAKSIAPLIEEECEKYGIEYTLKFTTGPKQATYLAIEGIKEGYCKIVAVGGDGTLNEVVNGLGGSNAILGIIPAGTGNDFVKSVYKNTELAHIIKCIVNGKTKRIDLGICNGSYFINISSGGFDSEVVLESEKNRAYLSGAGSYLAAVIKTIFLYKPQTLKVRIDQEEFEKKVLLVAVANGRYYGGGFMPTPEADLLDGVLDICVVEKMPKLKMLLLFHKYRRGVHRGVKGVSFYRGRNVSLVSKQNLAVNIDGEVSRCTEVQFGIVPKGIRIVSET